MIIRYTVKALLSPQGAYLISGLNNGALLEREDLIEGGGGGGGLLHSRLKIVFVQNTKKQQRNFKRATNIFFIFECIFGHMMKIL